MLLLSAASSDIFGLHFNCKHCRRHCEGCSRGEAALIVPPGEFEIIIKIYFVDPNERPVTIYHHLKLFNHDPNNPVPQIVKNKIVVSEHYDEIVFQDPSLMMSQLLNSQPKPFINGPIRHEIDFDKKSQKTAVDLDNAKKKVRTEINALKDRLRKALEIKAKFESELKLN